MRFACIVILLSLICSGCRVNPRAEREIALLRAEILDLEDQYYMIKSQRDSAVSRLHECGISYDPQGFPVEGLPGNPIGSGTNVIYENAPGVFDRPTLKIEDQDPPKKPATSRQTPPSSASYARTTRQRTATGDANSVSKVMVNRRLSGGQDLDGITGDEGISLMIQPLDDSGAVQKAAGQVVVRIDEDLGAATARQIGLWEFTSDEIESFFVKDDYPEQGILLHLPWNAELPENRRIRVTVLFITPNRKNLETSIEFNIVPPPQNYSVDDPVIASWIESDDRWRDLDTSLPPPQAESSNQRVSDVDSSAPRVSAPKWRPVR